MFNCQLLTANCQLKRSDHKNMCLHITQLYNIEGGTPLIMRLPYSRQASPVKYSDLYVVKSITFMFENKPIRKFSLCQSSVGIVI